jgi:hypothetical protein
MSGAFGAGCAAELRDLDCVLRRVSSGLMPLFATVVALNALGALSTECPRGFGVVTTGGRIE